MKTQIAAATCCAFLFAASCTDRQTETHLTKSGLDPERFKTEFQGDSTALFVLANTAGMEACITNFGGRVVSLMVPDRNGNLKDVALGFDSIQAYFPENNLTDFGASIGRYANRIDKGTFTIDGEEFHAPLNNGPHSLHGGGELGTLGWQYRVYKANQPNDSTLVLTIESPDGDNGYPGNVTATVTYSLLPDNTLDIRYTAVTDKPTIVNLTNHTYFNLNGDPAVAATNHLLTVNSSSITPIDSTFMTYGTTMDVEGTPFDFRTETETGSRIDTPDNVQLANGHGYDHNFILDTNRTDTIAAAVLRSPLTGIGMEVFTDEPGIQIYSGNFLDGTVTGKRGQKYGQRAAICLETQHYPDSPNKPQWPSTRLNPGEKYTSHCAYRFFTD